MCSMPDSPDADVRPVCCLSQYISELLRLSPDIAGVTLLAFASGAPDIFTGLAAIDGGAKSHWHHTVRVTAGPCHHTQEAAVVNRLVES